MMNEDVRTIMTTDLITVKPTTQLSTVRQIFMSHKIHHLPVMENGELVGLITTYDMWKNEIAPSDYTTTEVSKIMTTSIAKIGPYDKIGTAAELFLDNRFHALPVVNEHNHLVGIVTSFDVLLYEFKKEYPNPILYKNLFEKNQVNLTPA